MDYNHGCKKMFTKGQVQRMREALVHPARVNHWSVENLIATGGITLPSDRAIRFFNDSNGTLTAIATKEIATLEVRDINGKLLYQGKEASQTVSLNSVQLEGLLFYLTTFSDNTTEKGKFFAR